jgi:hypothetical protein
MPDWFMGWARTITLFDVLLWVAGLVAVVAFIKKGWPSLKAFATALLHFVQIVDAVQGLPDFIIRTDDTLARQDVKIQGIFHETHKNDGSSIKDSQDRTEATIKNDVLPALSTLATANDDIRADIEAIRAAKTVTSVEVTTQKETP